MQKIVLLGATGTLGSQILDIIESYTQHFQVIGMSANSQKEKLIRILNKFGCGKFVLHEDKTQDERQIDSLLELVTNECDHLIVADHGLGSLEVVLKTLSMQKRVSIANKELLVVHGADIVSLARKRNTILIPLDSEHNAIFQCLQGERIDSVERLIITASGGPFLDKTNEDLRSVKLEQVLKHPNWKMGRKTTVDSATMVNKAFEVIETHQVFGIPYDRIEVRLHPESIVHAIVEFTDGSSKMLAYSPDMRFAIGYALFFPDRAPCNLIADRQNTFDFAHDLHFSRFERGVFPCFDLFLDYAKNHPASLQELVEKDQYVVTRFLSGEIAFAGIYNALRSSL